MATVCKTVTHRVNNVGSIPTTATISPESMMLFDKAFLQDRTGSDYVSSRITSHSRWSIQYEEVFRHDDGKFYKTTYSVGATEMQDECPYEYEGEQVECPEVFPVTKTIIVYE